MRADLQRLKRDTESGKSVATPENRSRTRSGRLTWMAAAVVVGVALFLAASYYYLRRQQTTLTERETVVLAEFTNTTGDPVFDGTLRQGLSSQLEQSPFLDILSDSRSNFPTDAPSTRYQTHAHGGTGGVPAYAECGHD